MVVTAGKSAVSGEGAFGGMIHIAKAVPSKKRKYIRIIIIMIY